MHIDKQIKLAQMNTKAVIQKLTEYEARIAEQDKRIIELTGKMAQLEQRVNQHLSTAALAASFGRGPTVNAND